MSISAPPLDPLVHRADFPILQQRLPGDLPLVYLDSAATSQRPRQVVAAMAELYERYYGNVRRGAHYLATASHERVEAAREKVRALIGAASRSEIVFTSGTTAAINLVARSWGDANVQAGDEILLTQLEHHSNLVPWQQLAARTGARLRFIPVNAGFTLDLAALDELLTPRTRIVALAGVSNVLGTINPVAEVIRRAHEMGAVALVDGAQSVPHEPTDVRALDADFLAFSGHKMLGPTGVGVLYGKRRLLEEMPPFLGGGGMVAPTVTWETFETADRQEPDSLPAKFEAGTPPIAEIVGLGAALDYLEQVGLEAIARHERLLTERAHEQLAAIEGLSIFGPPADQKAGIVSLSVAGLATEDIVERLDGRYGIAVRGGHHCAIPLHERFGLRGTTRASFYFYNTLDEVDFFARALAETVAWYRRPRRAAVRRPS